MNIFLASVILLLTLIMISRVSDTYFIQSLKIISQRLKLSPDVAGATFMAIGSSAPELFTAIVAVMTVGAESIGPGTIVGSALFNILVIVGVSCMITTAYLQWKPMLRDLAFYGASVLLLLITFSDGIITVSEALIFLLMYGVYLLVLKAWKNGDHVEEDFDLQEPLETSNRWTAWADKIIHLTCPNPYKNPNWYLATFTICVIWIALLSWGMVESAVFLARSLHVSEAVIALTILAIGTSIPDLLASIAASKRKHSDMAVSNAIGSNTFDILIGLGLPWLGYSLITGHEVQVQTEELITSSLLLLGTITFILFLLLIQRCKIGKYWGAFMIAVYAGYLVYAVMRVV